MCQWIRLDVSVQAQHAIHTRRQPVTRWQGHFRRVSSVQKSSKIAAGVVLFGVLCQETNVVIDFCACHDIGPRTGFEIDSAACLVWGCATEMSQEVLSRAVVPATTAVLPRPSPLPIWTHSFASSFPFSAAFSAVAARGSRPCVLILISTSWPSSLPLLPSFGRSGNLA